tara:strand:+ start:1355 stop:1882 length:528 start_codon:yes stop_codon:yes gene_type:complete
MKKLLLYAPIAIFFLIVFFLLVFLLQNKDANKPPSPFINKDLPNFNITSLFDSNEKISNNEIKDKQVLINFFASWCLPCKAEHPFFDYLKKNNPDLIIIGINHKDKFEEAINFLEINGNPYNFVGEDKNGKVGLEFGVFGLPETFLTNSKGKIVYKITGPITKKIIKDEINLYLE